jgi:hypothetical protein
VWGQVSADVDTAIGVHGEAQGRNSNGVKGEAHNGPAAYGVWGRSTSGSAGVFGGQVKVFGTLTTTGKAFRIDHPFDPENKYLSHSSVESDVMLNVYSGRVQTDADGNAVVSLPTYFEALNEDFRYQLTVIREFAQAIVADEVHDNRFAIRTDRPNVTVCWQVTDVRKDPYAQQYPIVVEEDKPEWERGTYLHPEVYGQPESRYIDYERIQGIKDVQPALPKDWTHTTELRPQESE